ncbi:MAG: glycoside hydrolase [Chloroflexi bacterium]|nr:glycoside hydrolase [Chloroflexota bacterium]MCI0576909.1 glycoside hydrolase [Chloroflexota bacterium]MCI0646437.1 glycoside hydrolase [Chloroflexota bacterium]MCI0731415.1 glycoside hydrolase [Chloroflexota bacterium]
MLRFNDRGRLRLGGSLLAFLAFSLLTVTIVLAAHVVDGPDVEVTIDNNNVDGGVPNPGFDAQNRQANETTVAVSPIDPAIVAAGGNDYRMVPVFGDSWFGLYLSQDGGATWFNTMVPGFGSDTSPAGLASPLLGLDGSGDPVVRFDSAGNLYLAGIAFNRNFDQPDRPVDTVVYVARYDYTPGTPAGVSTPNSAANPANFTYVSTTIVDQGAVGFAVPNQPFGFAGDFVDKEWMEVDANPASPCHGNVYVTWTSFHGLNGGFPIKFSASGDGGATFGPAKTISSGGPDTNNRNQGSDIAVASDGTVYVAYHSFPSSNNPNAISVVSSDNCGQHWTQPVIANTISTGQAPGVAFRTPTFAFVVTDDSDPDLVYVAYQNLVGGNYEVQVQRSTDGGATWGAPVTVNDDGGPRHQIFPTIDVSNGALHVAWYDFRNSVTPDNEALDVYYACSNCDGNAYPAFSHNERVTDVSHNGNCRMFGGGSAAFHGDYNELDSYWDGTNHIVHLAWADNRDVPAAQCDLDPAAGPPSNNVGNRNQNIYADTLIVSP